MSAVQATFEVAHTGLANRAYLSGAIHAECIHFLSAGQQPESGRISGLPERGAQAIA
jgi:hypothetical protein